MSVTGGANGRAKARRVPRDGSHSSRSEGKDGSSAIRGRPRGGFAVSVAKKALGVILLLVSLGILAYPAAMSVGSSFRQEEVATTVLSVADETDDEERLRYLAQARKYNLELAMSAGARWADDSPGNRGNAGTVRDIVHNDPSFSSDSAVDDGDSGGDATGGDVTDGSTDTNSDDDGTDAPVATVGEDGTTRIEVSSSKEVDAFYERLYANAMSSYSEIEEGQGRSISYGSQLSWRVPDTMGVLEIPSIGTKLVIRHGTEESALSAGAGHLVTSSLPVGGLSSHCVISGHSGMSSARMFDDLDLMREGDVFLLQVLDDMYAYRVYAIEEMVEPEDLYDRCRIEEGRDLCTLFTCMPYGVNSHRLLVHGERIPYDADSEELVWNMTRVYVNDMTKPLIVALAGAVALWLVILTVLVARRVMRRRA